MNQIRLQKTPEIAKVLSYLQSRYRILSEAEIIKVALSEKYQKEIEQAGEIPSQYFKQTLAKSQKSLKEGKGSPVFQTGEETVKWLEKQGI
jgi:hypothetical protein